MNAVVSVVSVSAVCDQVDQGDQVVPAHQVDDIDEVHELDPVLQVDHKDERCDDIGRFLGRHRSFLTVLAVFDGCWSLFGSIFAKNVRVSLVFTRDSWPPGILQRIQPKQLQARLSRPRVLRGAG